MSILNRKKQLKLIILCQKLYCLINQFKNESIYISLEIGMIYSYICINMIICYKTDIPSILMSIQIRDGLILLYNIYNYDCWS